MLGLFTHRPREGSRCQGFNPQLVFLFGFSLFFVKIKKKILTLICARRRLKPTLTWALTGEAETLQRRNFWRSCPTSRTWRTCWLSWFTDSWWQLASWPAGSWYTDIFWWHPAIADWHNKTADCQIGCFWLRTTDSQLASLLTFRKKYGRTTFKTDIYRYLFQKYKCLNLCLCLLTIYISDRNEHFATN